MSRVRALVVRFYCTTTSGVILFSIQPPTVPTVPPSLRPAQVPTTLRTVRDFPLWWLWLWSGHCSNSSMRDQPLHVIRPRINPSHSSPSRLKSRTLLCATPTVCQSHCMCITLQKSLNCCRPLNVYWGKTSSSFVSHSDSHQPATTRPLLVVLVFGWRARTHTHRHRHSYTPQLNCNKKADVFIIQKARALEYCRSGGARWWSPCSHQASSQLNSSSPPRATRKDKQSLLVAFFYCHQIQLVVS